MRYAKFRLDAEKNEIETKTKRLPQHSKVNEAIVIEQIYSSRIVGRLAIGQRLYTYICNM